MCESAILAVIELFANRRHSALLSTFSLHSIELMDKTKEFKKNLESSLENLPSPQHFSTPKSKTTSKSLSYNKIRLRTASLYTWLAEIRTSCATESMSTLQNKSIKSRKGVQNVAVANSNTNGDIIPDHSAKHTISEELQRVLSLLNESNEATW